MSADTHFPPWKMDFTPATYTRLLEALQAAGYASQTIAGFFEWDMGTL